LRTLFLGGICLLFCLLASANVPAKSDSLKNNRLLWVKGGGTLLYGSSMLLLNEMWYKDYPRSKFHFFNDNDQWLGMDKIGHAYTAYHASVYGMKTLQWADVPHKKAVLYGALYGTVFLSSIEILDGFSEKWGASWGDIIANTSGSALAVSQELIWEEQRLLMKYSFKKSPYAKYRPAVLGSTLAEQMLKDYNGQSYWISGNIKSFLPESMKFPPWLMISLGYSANEMLTGKAESGTPNWSIPHPNLIMNRYRQYFLSIDIQTDKIKTGKKIPDFLLTLLSMVKVPAPALELQKGKLKAHWLYY